MKMWEGRFSQQSDRLMELFNNSLPVDQALIEEDVLQNKAWSKALAKAKIVQPAESDAICIALDELLADYAQGRLAFSAEDEDIHMALERLVTQKAGVAGAKLHTGRSRNDQVATVFRMYVKKALKNITGLVSMLQSTLVGRADNEQDIFVPGYTHLQQAQPVVLAHYWLSLFWALEREKSRLDHAASTADSMPLGAGALAGSGFAVDREFLARELGFGSITDNSMDAVAARDFVLEALFAITSLAIVLSRYAEDLIIWSSGEFGFIELADAWSTGSSMMPQKKNPDSLELIRGKCGRFAGNLTRMATTLKGLGLTYYKDLQEDKEPLLDSVAQIVLVLNVFAQVVATLTVKQRTILHKMDPFLYATDIADYLVARNVPFREAHRIVGKIVAFCIENRRELSSLSTAEFARFSSAFAEDVGTLFTLSNAVAHRDLHGGTGPESIARQLRKAKKLLD
ncbi:MAG: argininosuccinate lyase [Chitinivibrionales bacterium]|nr:argininosuccinate lyase [Chitinivibrionales bacterium]